MYTQSGELVIISGGRKYFKRSEFKSLRFRIIFLVILAGIIPGVILKAVVLKSYAVSYTHLTLPTILRV